MSTSFAQRIKGIFGRKKRPVLSAEPTTPSPRGYKSPGNALVKGASTKKAPVVKKPAPTNTQLPYDRDTALKIATVAEQYGMTPSEMFASLYQESSFGKNPSAKRENYATALGDLQITRPYTDRAKLAYPAYPELFIEPNDRLDLMKSVDFRGKHFKRFYDIYGDRDKAINAYYGDSTYAPKIRAREQEEVIRQLLQLIGK